MGSEMCIRDRPDAAAEAAATAGASAARVATLEQLATLEQQLGSANELLAKLRKAAAFWKAEHSKLLRQQHNVGASRSAGEQPVAREGAAGQVGAEDAGAGASS